jgi:hypothetical protein
MKNRVTLVTPPDTFENANKSILVIDLSEKEQDDLSKWLGECQDEFDLNIYFYQGEPDIPWLFHAVARADYVYLNLDNYSDIGHLLCSYILSKTNVWYTSGDKNLVSLYTHINQRYVNNVDEFLRKAINED